MSTYFCSLRAKMVNGVSTSTPCCASQVPESLSFSRSIISWPLICFGLKRRFFINKAAYTPCPCNSTMASGTQKPLSSTTHRPKPNILRYNCSNKPVVLPNNSVGSFGQADGESFSSRNSMPNILSLTPQQMLWFLLPKR
jgi:hypothetical protein